MDTSSSRDEAPATESWLAGARLFSGRADPVWTVSNAIANKLLHVWSALALAPCESDLPEAGLGYRGCYLKNERGDVWFVSRGVVAHTRSEEKDCRRDEKHSFERRLLASAPEGTIPNGFLASWW